jgi:RHS repeat-associated protein
MVQVLEFIVGNAGSYHYHYDGNGNVVEFTNVSATVVASYRYDAFGRTLVKAGTYADTNRYRFSTKPVELTSGLYYYGYRYYDPLHGRWTTRDPIAEDGGFNIYAMTENSLISGYDILGMANAPKMCCPQGQNLVKACGTGESCCSGSLKITRRKMGAGMNPVSEQKLSQKRRKMKHKITWRSVLIVLASLVCAICYTVYDHTIKWGKISRDSSNITLMRDKLTVYYLSNKAFPDKLPDAVGNGWAAEYQYVNCGDLLPKN